MQLMGLPEIGHSKYQVETVNKRTLPLLRSCTKVYLTYLACRGTQGCALLGKQHDVKHSSVLNFPW